MFETGQAENVRQVFNLPLCIFYGTLVIMDDKCPVKKVTVKFFKSGNDNEPVKNWLRSLSSNDRKIIGVDIKTVELGWPIGMPLVRKLNKGLWEVRSDLYEGCIGRVLFTVKGHDMVLLHGFIKKSQKTPKKDLNLANNRRRAVYKR